MAVEILTYPIPVPLGTPIASPLVVPTLFPPRTVQRISWRVPPGPRGEVGWRISMGQVVVVPHNGGWIITDNEASSWDVENQPDSGAWQVTIYNTGAFAHTIYITYHVTLPGIQLSASNVTPGVEMAGTTVV
jgi:hypothetical protein